MIWAMVMVQALVQAFYSCREIPILVLYRMAVANCLPWALQTGEIQPRSAQTHHIKPTLQLDNICAPAATRQPAS